MDLDIWAVSAIATKFALYIGILTASGAVLFRMVFRDILFREAEWGARILLRPSILWFSGLGLVATVLSYGLHAAAEFGRLSGLRESGVLALLWDAPEGVVFVLRISGLTLMIASLLFPRGGRFLALVGVALVLWSFGQIGHATRFDFPWLAVILSVHLAAVAFWIGVLVPLYRLSQERAHLAEAADLAHRFGQIASVVVPVLLLAGVVFAWNLLGSFAMLIGTPYGWVLLLKIAVVGAALGLSILSKLRFVPALQAGDEQAASALRRAIRYEVGAFAVILLITAVMTSLLSVPQ